MIHFVVYGKPQPAGSKRSFVPVNKKTGQPFRSKTTGRVVVNTVDANPNAGDWKQQIAAAAREAHAGKPLLDGPVQLGLTFFFQRPKGHYRTGRNSHLLRDSAPREPISRPDTTKLVRCAEDALKGIIWRDDCQVTRQFAQKQYGEPPRVEVTIEEIVF